MKSTTTLNNKNKRKKLCIEKEKVEDHEKWVNP